MILRSAPLHRIVSRRHGKNRMYPLDDLTLLFSLPYPSARQSAVLLFKLRCTCSWFRVRYYLLRLSTILPSSEVTAFTVILSKLSVSAL